MAEADIDAKLLKDLRKAESALAKAHYNLLAALDSLDSFAETETDKINNVKGGR